MEDHLPVNSQQGLKKSLVRTKLSLKQGLSRRKANAHFGPQGWLFGRPFWASGFPFTAVASGYPAQQGKRMPRIDQAEEESIFYNFKGRL